MIPKASLSDVSIGVWSIYFGQLVFKFIKPIPGMPQQIVFNGLLPAIGVKMGDDKHEQQDKNKQATSKEEKDSEKEGRSKDEDEIEEKEEEEEEEEEENKDKRRLASGDDEDDEDDEDDIKNTHSASGPDGISRSQFKQTMTQNGFDGHRNDFRFWVVHNDPDEKSAYAIAVSTDEKRLFNTKSTWKKSKYYCSKNGFQSSVEYKGDCDDLRSDIQTHVDQHLSKKHKYCKKIVLCKNGAFEFVFKEGYIRDREIKDLYLFAAKVTGECGENDCNFNQLSHVRVTYEHQGKSRCPKPSIALDFTCDTPYRTKEDIYPEYEFKESQFFGNQLGMEYRVIPPQKPKSNNKKSNDEEENEEDQGKDPFGCDGRTARNRPRFQLRSPNSDRITTCCIKRPPSYVSVVSNYLLT